jgi:hypothetical protein
VKAATEEREVHVRRIVGSSLLLGLLTACEDAGNAGDDNLLTGGSLVLLVIIAVIVFLVVRRRR